LGGYEEAIPCFDRAIELKPKDAYAWNNKGVSFYRLGKYEEAVAYYDKALDINPKHAYALYLRACFKIKKGDIKEGLVDLKKAIEIDKSYIESTIEDKDFDSVRIDEKFKALF
jgi:tetratricopeptide (TPR) repeat protein